MPKRALRVEDLFSLRAVGRCAISPDGQRVAFELKRFDAAENKNFTRLMLVDVADGALRELTRGNHVDSSPRWSPSGRELAFLSNRDKGTCLFVLPMAGGEPRRVTPPDGFVHDFDWSPDGRRFVFTRQAMSEREIMERDGKEAELKKRPQFKHITRLFHRLDGQGWWNGAYTHVWTCSASGGGAKQLTRGDFDHSEPRFSPDGRSVSFTANRTPNPDADMFRADVFVMPASGGALRNLTNAPGSRRGTSWSPDGRTIAFIGERARAGRHDLALERVWLIDVKSGTARELTRDVDNHCFNTMVADVASSNFAATPPLWSADSRRVFFILSEHGACRLYSRSVDRRDTRCEIGGDVNIYHAHRASPDGPIALSMGDATNPGDVCLLEGTRGKATERRSHGATSGAAPDPLRRLTSVNAPVLDRVDLTPPRLFTVRSDNTTLEGWFITPPKFDPRRKYPAILQIHGGPHAQYGCGFFHELHWLAARGYIVVFANPRGSTGRGLAFQKCIAGDWGNLDYRDVMRVADWIFTRPFVDKRRVGVTGGSYGGYMTNWIVGHTQRFRAAVTQRSVVNLESMAGTSDCGGDIGLSQGAWPWEDPQRYRRQSPLTHVANIRTPLLIEHEEQDYRCSIEQAEQLFTALKVLGRTVELVRFEGESHGLCRMGRPQNRGERLRRIVGWFDRHMG